MACVFVAIILVLTYPALNTELASIAETGVMISAIRIVVPFFWFLGILASLTFAGYEALKG